MTSSVQRNCSTFGEEITDSKGGENKILLYELSDQIQEGWMILIGHEWGRGGSE